ncbi:MAG: alginate lyase family protein [Pseudomonadales bacterium]
MLRKILQLVNTLKYLRIKQLFFFIVRRRFATAYVIYGGCPSQREDFELAQPLPVTGLWKSHNTFNFLNIDKALSLQNLDWCPEDVSRLWRYNLHYFDYLREAARSDDEKLQLLESWVANNPQGSQPGWEPFTASLRIVNWVFYLQHCPRAQTLIIMQSLYTQVLWLEKNDERHILANHYFENLKALTFAGAFFSGEDATRWLTVGTQGMKQQLKEQTLADGGHYERSPQYHALMLENYLDLYNLSSNNACFSSLAIIDSIKQTAVEGLRFLEGIVFPDQKLPLFNDSTFGVAPELAALNEYAEALAVDRLPQSANSLIHFESSGLYGYRSGSDMVIIDCGDIGPSYQPGHTHCDFLSYELMFGGQRLVVDTGVYEYEPGEMRHYVRSTKAHNTIAVDGDEQSEIWGEFRVARRAQKLWARSNKKNNTWLFEGAFKGFYGIKGGIEHSRKVEVHHREDGAIESLKVADTVRGSGQHHVESYIHFHPDVHIEQQGCELILLKGEQPIAKLAFDADLNFRVENSHYCPEFGLKLDNQCVVVFLQAELPCQLGYTFSRVR